MAFLEWSDALQTGFEGIDRQHKKIFSLLNSIYEYNRIQGVDCTQSKSGEALIRKKVNTLLDYIYTHFDYEELLMKENNYSFKDEHIHEHKIFKDRVNEIISTYSNSMYALIFELCKFIKEFYLDHIIYYDKRLAKELNF